MAIELTPSVAEPRAAIDAVRIDVAGASNNDTVGYDPGAYPSEPEIRMWIAFIKDDIEYGRSYVFSPAQDGTHVFDNYIFPSAGSWTMSLRRIAPDPEDPDVVLKDQAITVS